jgi:glycerol-1-phosphate dehydrogenase [NAD(P)+]
MAVEFPEIFFGEDDPSDEDLAAEELARVVRDLGIESPFVLASHHGERLAGKLEGPRAPERPATPADQKWAADLGSRAHRSGADAIVAIGGGRILDIGKLAAARAGLPIVVSPTQLSHDGICSPVAVVPNEEGRAESIGAIAPRAAFMSLPTLLGAPAQSVAAGIGDLLANPLALRDWALAAERGLDEIDQRAWDLSVQSFQLVEPRLGEDPASLVKDHAFLKLLADALVQSGMAMICSGTSRPASGGEHEISHALDEEFGGRALHGEQVAFGCIVSVALYEEDPQAFRERLRALGLPQEPGDLGLSIDDVVRVIVAAPETRPGRFTILEEADLDEAQVRALVDRIWR